MTSYVRTISELTRDLLASEARVEALESENDMLRRCMGWAKLLDQEAAFMRRWGLTAKEAAVVRALYAAHGRTLSKDGLLDILYNQAADCPEHKIVDVFVCKARRKMGAEAISTVWGRGYRISPYGLQVCNEALEAAIGAQVRVAS